MPCDEKVEHEGDEPAGHLRGCRTPRAPTTGADSCNIIDTSIQPHTPLPSSLSAHVQPHGELTEQMQEARCQHLELIRFCARHSTDHGHVLVGVFTAPRGVVYVAAAYERHARDPPGARPLHSWRCIDAAGQVAHPMRTRGHVDTWIDGDRQMPCTG